MQIVGATLLIFSLQIFEATELTLFTDPNRLHKGIQSPEQGLCCNLCSEQTHAKLPSPLAGSDLIRRLRNSLLELGSRNYRI